MILGNDENQNYMQQEISKQDKKLQEENQELKNKVDFYYQDFRKKLQDVQQHLGIDQDLEKFATKPAQKDIQQFKLQKEALIKVENLQRQINDQENKIEKLQKIIENCKKQDFEKQEKFSCIKLENQERIKRLNEQTRLNKMQHDEELRKLAQEKDDQIKRIIEKNKYLIEEKMNTVGHLGQAIQSKTSENQKMNDLKKQTKFESEKEFKKQQEIIQYESKKIQDNLKQQYEQHLKQKNEDIMRYKQEIVEYKNKKDQQIIEQQGEILGLYQAYQKLYQIIDKIETGEYTGGRMSINIPQRDKPALPNRQKYYHLYSILDSKQIKVMQLNEDLQKLRNRTEDERLQSRIDINFNLNQFKNPEKDFANLKMYTERIKKLLDLKCKDNERLQDKLNQFDLINNQLDFEELQKQNFSYKDKFLKIQKANTLNKSKLDYYKRLDNSRKTSEFQIRPHTTQYKNRIISHKV